MMAARGGKVLLEVPAGLLRLAQRLPGAAEVLVSGAATPTADFNCSLMSLPRAFATTVATIPGEVPYLEADAAQAEVWRHRLENFKDLRIGLVWAGGTATKRIDRRRSIALEHFAPLGDVPGVSFVSLQKGPPALQVRSPPPAFRIHDWTNELRDFADTAALIEALDLVIGVDTAVVHLAGALGKPVWLLNRFDSCWRWLLDRDDSPWYPTARLFRQDEPRAWDSTIARVHAALCDFVQHRSVNRTSALPPPSATTITLAQA